MNLRSAVTLTGILFNFLIGGELPQEKYHFYQNGGESSPSLQSTCSHSGPHTRTNNFVFKKIQCTVFSMKETEKTENRKNHYLNKSENSLIKIYNY